MAQNSRPPNANLSVRILNIKTPTTPSFNQVEAYLKWGTQQFLFPVNQIVYRDFKVETEMQPSTTFDIYLKYVYFAQGNPTAIYLNGTVKALDFGIVSIDQYLLQFYDRAYVSSNPIFYVEESTVLFSNGGSYQVQLVLEADEESVVQYQVIRDKIAEDIREQQLKLIPVIASDQSDLDEFLRQYKADFRVRPATKLDISDIQTADPGIVKKLQRYANEFTRERDIMLWDTHLGGSIQARRMSNRAHNMIGEFKDPFASPQSIEEWIINSATGAVTLPLSLMSNIMKHVANSIDWYYGLEPTSEWSPAQVIIDSYTAKQYASVIVPLGLNLPAILTATALFNLHSTLTRSIATGIVAPYTENAMQYVQDSLLEYMPFEGIKEFIQRNGIDTFTSNIMGQLTASILAGYAVNKAVKYTNNINVFNNRVVRHKDIVNRGIYGMGSLLSIMNPKVGQGVGQVFEGADRMLVPYYSVERVGNYMNSNDDIKMVVRGLKDREFTLEKIPPMLGYLENVQLLKQAVGKGNFVEETLKSLDFLESIDIVPYSMIQAAKVSLNGIQGIERRLSIDGIQEKVVNKIVKKYNSAVGKLDQIFTYQKEDIWTNLGYNPLDLIQFDDEIQMNEFNPQINYGGIPGAPIRYLAEQLIQNFRQAQRMGIAVYDGSRNSFRNRFSDVKNVISQYREGLDQRKDKYSKQLEYLRDISEDQYNKIRWERVEPFIQRNRKAINRIKFIGKLAAAQGIGGALYNAFKGLYGQAPVGSNNQIMQLYQQPDFDYVPKLRIVDKVKPTAPKMIASTALQISPFQTQPQDQDEDYEYQVTDQDEIRPRKRDLKVTEKKATSGLLDWYNSIPKLLPNLLANDQEDQALKLIIGTAVLGGTYLFSSTADTVDPVIDQIANSSEFARKLIEDVDKTIQPNTLNWQQESRRKRNEYEMKEIGRKIGKAIQNNPISKLLRKRKRFMYYDYDQ